MVGIRSGKWWPYGLVRVRTVTTEECRGGRMGYNSNDDANTEEKKILGAEKKN